MLVVCLDNKLSCKDCGKARITKGFLLPGYLMNTDSTRSIVSLHHCSAFVVSTIRIVMSLANAH